MNEAGILEAYFEECKGVEIYIEESLRFLIHDPHSIAYIQEGSVDLFALNVQGELLFTSKDQLDDLGLNTSPFLAELLEGSLTYLGSLNQGDLVFQFPFSAQLDSIRILGIALTPLKLKKTSFRVFQEDLNKAPELLQKISELVNTWVSMLSTVLNPNPNASHFYHSETINFGETVRLPPKNTLGHFSQGSVKEKQTLVWVKLLEGVLGLELPSIQEKSYYKLLPGAPPFPLPQNLTLQCLEEATATGLTLENIVEQNMFTWAILCFHQAALQGIASALRMNEIIETTIAKQRIHLDQTIFSDTLKNASQILEEKEHYEISTAQDPLMRACEYIGERERMSFLLPPYLPRNLTLEDRVSDICRYSHVNFRKVYLNSGWWQQTDGYLLCFDTANNPMVAHCNIGRHSYIFDPKNSSKIPLNENTAKGIRRFGYVFYRSLSEKVPLNLWDLIRFTLFKKGRQIRTILLCGFLAALVSLFIPYATHVIFDQVIPTLDATLLWQVAFAMVVSVVSTALFQLTKEYTLNRMLSVIDTQLVAAIWDRVLKLKASFFRKYEAGDLYLRLQGISDMAKQIAGSPLRILLNALFSTLYLLSMWYYSPGLTLVALAVIVITSLITGFFMLRNFPLLKEIMDIKGFTSSKVIEMIQAIVKIRTSGLEKRAFSYWLTNFNSAKNLEKQQLSTQNIISALLSFAPNAAYFFILGLIIYRLSYPSETEPYISVGALMAFLAAFAPFQDSVFECLKTVIDLQTLKPQWDRVKGILAEQPEYDRTKLKLSTLQGSIRFEHVSFRYSADAPLVLKDISLHANPGEFIGIVGLSGAGKSTIIRLITGLEEPEQGEIFVDNHSLKNLDLQNFRRQISTVLQQIFIMSGTIREFLSGGRHFPDARLMQALNAAGFTDDLKNLPMGLNTVLINGAGTFSGGQRQRLILAKALVSNPKILLLDEATSALDNQTQELVKKNLDAQQITRIVVAHRLSTVRMADRIYVLDEGKIADEGTFEELSNRMGLFSLLLAKQKG